MATPYANSLQSPPKNDEFFTTKIQDKQSEISMEFLSSDTLGLNAKVVRYFDGNTEHEVQRHFRRAFYTSMANNSREAAETNHGSLPMRQRKFPASFWRQDSGNQPGRPIDMATNSISYPVQNQHMYTDMHHTMQWQNNGITHPTIGQFQANTTSTTIGQFQGGQAQCRYSDVPSAGYQPVVSSRLVSYSKLPMSIVSVPNVTITHAQMDSRPRCSISDASAVYYTRGPTTGHGFNPRYNTLLVQPEVMLQLPLVHGQPREAGIKKG